MTWTSRKHRDLMRLLGEYCREHPDTATGDAWYTVLSHLWLATPDHEKIREEDYDLITPLVWWCGVMERRHGMRRHTALRWFVQQSYNKEERAVFRRRFGSGTVDSIARRLYQKAKTDGMFGYRDRSDDLRKALTGAVILAHQVEECPPMHADLEADPYALAVKAVEWYDVALRDL